MKEIITMIQHRRSFRTPQVWGEYIAPGVYAVGSTELVNDDDVKRITAVVNDRGECLQISPFANMELLREWVNGNEKTAEPSGAGSC